MNMQETINRAEFEFGEEMSKFAINELMSFMPQTIIFEWHKLQLSMWKQVFNKLLQRYFFTYAKETDWEIIMRSDEISFSKSLLSILAIIYWVQLTEQLIWFPYKFNY